MQKTASKTGGAEGIRTPYPFLANSRVGLTYWVFEATA